VTEEKGPLEAMAPIREIAKALRDAAELEGARLVVAGGWDLDDFWKRVDSSPKEVLEEALKILRQPDPPGSTDADRHRAAHMEGYVAGALVRLEERGRRKEAEDKAWLERTVDHVFPGRRKAADRVAKNAKEATSGIVGEAIPPRPFMGIEGLCCMTSAAVRELLRRAGQRQADELATLKGRGHGRDVLGLLRLRQMWHDGAEVRRAGLRGDPLERTGDGVDFGADLELDAAARLKELIRQAGPRPKGKRP
jgi:hypothetical protein